MQYYLPFLLLILALSYAANSPCGVTHTLTLADLNNFMGKSSGDKSLSSWVGPMNTALKRYSMNCAKRISAFLAQVRHETAGMTVFHQPLDNGAGTLHMTPANWQYACKEVPEIEAAFRNTFSGCSSCSCLTEMASNPMGDNAKKAATTIFSQPLVASLSGTWWFASGASNPSIFGWKGCGDLRLEADKELGDANGNDCHYRGFYQITCCIFYTISGSAGLQQRKDYYTYAQKIANGWTSALSEDTVSNSENMPVAAIVGISVGVSVFVVVVVVLIVLLFVRGVRRYRTVEEVA